MIGIYERLKEAYETSTLSNNRFLTAIKAVAWEDTFQADGEHYFIKDDLTFIVPDFNPFGIGRPSAIFSDGSYLEF